MNSKLQNNSAVLNYFVALKVNTKMVWNGKKNLLQTANDTSELKTIELTCLNKWEDNYFSEVHM